MLEGDRLWFKDAVIYELHVRSFFDSVGDGIGDFGGLTQRLDYLQDLGVTAIWLLPFYPSPLRDDGYDIADYLGVNPDYGTLDGFRRFLEAAHRRGLRVITELVLNHTSDQHPWFQRARRAPPGSVERDFYVWSDTPDRYRGVRVIFQDFEPSNWTFDHVAKAYFWHRFYSHQPDLNFDNPAVWEALFPIVDFWFELGVDGLRLDAVPYLYEREGTICENLPETHAFLRALRKHVDKRYPQRMLLAEANQWPEEAVTYFGQGDECHMAFHFPLMPRLFMAIHREDRFPVIDIMEQTPAIPDNCQWAVFLRNHDELTLEMVTDEERDFMYQAYAHDARARINLGIRRRLAPLLGNSRRRIELMNGLLFSLPGTPVIYYGDEIGMGDNIYLGDRNGVRTPMQWSGDRNAGFSRANPQRLYLPVVIDPEYHYESVNVEAQQNNPQSLLWWMKRLIDLRKRFTALSRGNLTFLHPDNRKILAFLRTYHDQTVLVVANTSRFVQYVELDLSQQVGAIPVEAFGNNPFPAIGRLPYLLTLGPHAIYWFQLRPHGHAENLVDEACPPTKLTPEIELSGSWEQLLDARRESLEQALECFLSRSPWSDASDSLIRGVTLQETFCIDHGDERIQLAIVDALYGSGAKRSFAVALAFAVAEKARDLLEMHPEHVIARVAGSTSGVVFHALAFPESATALAAAAHRKFTWRGSQQGELASVPVAPAPALVAETGPSLSLVRGGHFHTCLQWDNRWFMKFFRRLESGPHPEVTLGRLLSHHPGFPHTPALVSAIEYRRRRHEPVTLAVVHEYVSFETDLWQLALDAIGNYIDAVLTCDVAVAQPPMGPRSEAPHVPLPDAIAARVHEFTQIIHLLAVRTAEMHAALASEKNRPELAPEPFTTWYRRSMYQSVRGKILDVCDTLRKDYSAIEEATRPAADRVLSHKPRLLAWLKPLLEQPLRTERIRCHGDYRLEQLLFTGKDLVVIDFEGSPQSSLGERRIKRSPLRDVATMEQSLNFAGLAPLAGLGRSRGRAAGLVRPEDMARLLPWCRHWRNVMRELFVGEYLQKMEATQLLPPEPGAAARILAVLRLEAAINNLLQARQFRPAWVSLAVGLLDETVYESLAVPL